LLFILVMRHEHILYLVFSSVSSRPASILTSNRATGV
jgi:hypothetical protein